MTPDPAAGINAPCSLSAPTSSPLAFYVTTALFLLLGSWLLLAPRRWAMEGLRLHGLACLWLLKHIAGTRMEVRGHEHVPKGACLIVSKHQSAWDTFALVPLFRDPAIVLKDELNGSRSTAGSA